MPGIIDSYCSCFINFNEWACTAPPPPPKQEGVIYPPYFAYSYPPVEYVPVERNEQHKYMIISYCTCVFVVVAIFTFAMWYSWHMLKKRHHDQTADEFCTARGTQGILKISFSFWASAVGAWVITSPASFAVWVGWVGLLTYSVSAGLPLLILAICGGFIQARHEGIKSIGDFCGRRFGPVMKTITALVCIFTMSIAMLAEFTVIGALFKDYVGSVDYPMIIVVGVLTMIYTSVGGLIVSIATDQIQAGAILILITVLCIYVAVTFREPLPKPLPTEYFPLDAHKEAYGTIFSMPVSLMAATVFSEALWQKAWASKDRKTLVWAGGIAFFLVTSTVFIFGFFGFLAAWGGLVTYSTNINLYIFQVFSAEQTNVVGSSAMVQSWVGVITLILAIIMNTSAIDSFQNGITSAVSTHWFPDQHIIFPRVTVVCITVPIMIVALQDYPIINLFLLTNMICTCCFIPVMVGVFTDKFISESCAVFSICTAVLTCLAYGIGNNWDEDRVSDSFECGSWYTFFGNQNFEYLYFVFACVGSIAGIIIWESVRLPLKYFAKIEGPGISGVLGYLPGFKVITGHGWGVDILDYQPFKFLTLGKLHGPMHGVEKKEVSSSSSSSDEGKHEAAAVAAKSTPTVDLAVDGPPPS